MNITKFQLSKLFKNFVLILGCTFFIYCSKLFGQWIQIGQDVDGNLNNEQSGYVVAVSYDASIMAIGRPNQNEYGSVVVYQNQNNNWVQLGNPIPSELINDNTGRAVAISGDGTTVAVGSPSNSLVRIFRYINSDWIQVGNSIIGLIGEKKSLALSFNGDRLAIGFPQQSQVITYQLENNIWADLPYTIFGDYAADLFGTEVSLSSDGNFLAIGAPESSGSGNGYVKVFAFENDQWNQLGSTIAGDNLGDLFGYSVSISTSGLSLVVGAHNHPNGGGNGQVKVFDYMNSDWIQKGSSILGLNTDIQFGYSVSISQNGNTIASSADRSLSGKGLVRVYSFQNNDWTQVGSDIIGEFAFDQSGFCISMDVTGQVVVIGAPLNDADGIDRGHVRAYQYSCEDSDLDGICNFEDNCPNIYNPDQSDDDCDGVGNSCDYCNGGDDKIDNNNDGLPDCKHPPAYNQIISQWKCKNNKVYVAHKADNGNCNSLCVSYNAVQAHINHGDYLGPCDNSSCNGNSLSKFDKDLYQPLDLVTMLFEDKNSAEGNNSISVFPSISNSEFIIKLDSDENCLLKVEVYNLLGNKIESIDVKNEYVVKFGSNYPTGAYLIKSLGCQTQEYYNILKI
jgi:hypothetical protein